MYRDNIPSWCYDQPVYGASGYEDRMNSSRYKCRKQRSCCMQECDNESWERWRKCCCDPCDQWDEDKKQKEREKCDVNIHTSINICQNGEANGGEANGGNGGDATGGSAAAASAESEGEGDASAEASVSVSQKSKNNDVRTGTNRSPAAEEIAELDNVVLGEGASAIGGDATGGNGGAGGAGGNGGTVSNSATVTVENTVVVVCDGNGAAGLRINGNGRNLDIEVDENGDTFVNGQKMDEEKLADGTKVFLFKNSEVKKSE